MDQASLNVIHFGGDQAMQVYGFEGFPENHSALYSDLCAVCPNPPNQVLVLLQVDALYLLDLLGKKVSYQLALLVFQFPSLIHFWGGKWCRIALMFFEGEESPHFL